MRYAPLAHNPLRTRSDVQSAVVELCKPIEACFSPGKARVRLGSTSAHYFPISVEFEGFSRPLWGLIPLAAGNGEYEGWPSFLEGLVNGTNPDHPEYWGIPQDYDQRLVDLTVIGYGLASIPKLFWDPLSAQQRKNLTDWLNIINGRKLHDNNWLFFRVLVNLGLLRVGGVYKKEQMREDLERLESFYHSYGWYRDGAGAQCDYYNAFAMHYYGLIYAALSEAEDAPHAQRFRERASLFAQNFIHWFSEDGSALPYGRSLTYRFAQGAFWSALAFGNVGAFPWGVVKGLVLRHLRWWLRRPIFTESGLLTIGYGYPNMHMAEQYTSPASPYWAMKIFAFLTLPESHPFWTSTEQPLPSGPATVVQPQPQMVICRDGKHVFALAGGQAVKSRPRHTAEKYAKFCYSTHFGFSVPSAQSGPEFSAPDSTLALSEEGEYFRIRRECESVRFQGAAIVSVWRPWPEVEITTWLIPVPPWHLRIHCLRTDRKLYSLEGGFAVSREGDDLIPPDQARRHERGLSIVQYNDGASLIRDALGYRLGVVVPADTNTNLLSGRTVIPALVGTYEAGEHWLACSVAGWPTPKEAITSETPGPSCRITPDGFTAFDENGCVLLDYRMEAGAGSARGDPAR